MKYPGVFRCAICGEERSGNEPRFLLAENFWEDKLTILHWNEKLASRDGIQVACGLDHAEQLAILWMTTGRLDYPVRSNCAGSTAWRHISRQNSWVDLSGARRIGELAVHRESVERLLTENPQSIKGILDALLHALRQEIGPEAKTDSIEAQDGEQGNTCVKSLPRRNFRLRQLFTTEDTEDTEKFLVPHFLCPLCPLGPLWLSHC